MPIFITVTTSGLVELGLWNLVWRLMVNTQVDQYIFNSNTIPTDLSFQDIFVKEEVLMWLVLWSGRPDHFTVLFSST